MVTPSRCFLLENAPVYYPFGNTRGRNVLQDFKFEKHNVGEENLIKVIGALSFSSLILTVWFNC